MSLLVRYAPGMLALGIAYVYIINMLMLTESVLLLLNCCTDFDGANFGEDFWEIKFGKVGCQVPDSQRVPYE